MLYTIIDLIQNKIVAQCSTQEGVVFFFLNSNHSISSFWNDRKKTFTPASVFRSLNMSGNDMAAPEGCYLFFSYWNDQSDALFLRRHQVYDENGRIVDPRVWTKVYQKIVSSDDPYQFMEYVPKKRQKVTFPHSGRKAHFHRINLPATFYQTMKFGCDDWSGELDEFDILFDHSAMRGKRRIKNDWAWDTEKRLYRSSSRSWKDQTKSRTQWGKHKPSCKRAKETIIEDDLEQKYDESCYAAMLDFYYD